AALMGATVRYIGDESQCAYVVWSEGEKGSKPTLDVIYRHDAFADEENNALTKGFPVVTSMSGVRPWEAEQPGVRWIEVENLRRQVKTRLALSPGLNVLTGDINSGKSTLYFTALRAIAYGELEDSMIRHGA